MKKIILSIMALLFASQLMAVSKETEKTINSFMVYYKSFLPKKIDKMTLMKGIEKDKNTIIFTYEVDYDVILKMAKENKIPQDKMPLFLKFVKSNMTKEVQNSFCQTTTTKMFLNEGISLKSIYNFKNTKEKGFEIITTKKDCLKTPKDNLQAILDTISKGIQKELPIVSDKMTTIDKVSTTKDTLKVSFKVNGDVLKETVFKGKKDIKEAQINAFLTIFQSTLKNRWIVSDCTTKAFRLIMDNGGKIEHDTLFVSNVFDGKKLDPIIVSIDDCEK